MAVKKLKALSLILAMIFIFSPILTVSAELEHNEVSGPSLDYIYLEGEAGLYKVFLRFADDGRPRWVWKEHFVKNEGVNDVQYDYYYETVDYTYGDYSGTYRHCVEIKWNTFENEEYQTQILYSKLRSFYPEDVKCYNCGEWFNIYYDYHPCMFEEW